MSESDPTVPIPATESQTSVRRSGMVRLLQLVVFYTELAMFGLGTFLYNLFCLLSSLLPGCERRRSLHQRIGTRLLRFFLWMIDVSNLCKIQRPPPEVLRNVGPSVIIANHTGLMDAIVLNTLFPKAVCIFKSGLARNPIFSHVLRMGGHLRNDEGIDVIRKGAERANTQGHVIVFPEGTRNPCCTQFTFKKGFALIAQRAQLPVTLFAIHNPTHAFSKEMGIRAPELPFTLRFEVLETLGIESGESIDAFVNRVESIYQQCFQP
ncbi:MAG: lysophospholipid acyltransferase family protein [Puniceicoccaceae bacterium]